MMHGHVGGLGSRRWSNDVARMTAKMMREFSQASVIALLRGEAERVRAGGLP